LFNINQTDRILIDPSLILTAPGESDLRRDPFVADLSTCKIQTKTIQWPIALFSYKHTPQQAPTPEEVSQTLTELLVTLPVDFNYTLAQISKETGIDFYKYRNGQSCPGVKSLITGFHAMNLDPAWVCQLVSCMGKGIITYKQTCQILEHWDKCEQYAEGRLEEIVKRLLEITEEQ